MFTLPRVRGAEGGSKDGNDHKGNGMGTAD